MDVFLAQFDAATMASTLAGGMLVAWGVGWWLGRRRRIRYGDLTVSQWYGAVLSLLSLLLAFTVNTAIGKQNQRQQLAVADSQALHDCYTYAGMLNEPAKSKLQKLLREYRKLRIDLSQLLDMPSFENALRRSDQTEAQMDEVVAQVERGGTPLAAP